MPRWIWTRVLPALVSIVTVAAAYPVVRGRTVPALPQMEAAKQAVDAARHAGAATWAPDELEAAESAYRAARAEHRKQQVRFVSFRDFRAVKDSLVSAERLGREAAERARTRRQDTEGDAATAYHEAEQAVAEAQSFADAMPLGKAARSAYQKARLALDEARSHRARKDTRAALAAARRAKSFARDATQSAASTVSRYRDPESVRQWRQWIQETVEWSRANGTTAIVVDKDGHSLSLYERGRLMKTYATELGENWTADKRRSGDSATPEGRYRIAEKKGRGASTYYKALLIDYPNAEDRAAFARAKARGEIPASATPGGLIEIHGEGGRGRDWTRGCVALPNSDMDEVFAKVAVGTRVTIVGSDGPGGTLASLVERHGASKPSGSR